MLRHIAQTYYLCVVLLLTFLPQNVFSQEIVEEGGVPLARSHREGKQRVVADSLVVDTIRYGNVIPFEERRNTLSLWGSRWIVP